MSNIHARGVKYKSFDPSYEENSPPINPPRRSKSLKEKKFLKWYKKVDGLHRLILQKMVFLSRLQYERTGKFYCYPGLDYLAAELDSSVRTIRRRVQKLSDWNLVKITKRGPLPDGTQQSNLYKPWNGLLSYLREKDMDDALEEFFLNEQGEQLSEADRIRNCGRPYYDVKPQLADDEEKPEATSGPIISTLRKKRLKISYLKKDKRPTLALGSFRNQEEEAVKGNRENQPPPEGTNGNGNSLKHKELINTKELKPLTFEHYQDQKILEDSPPHSPTPYPR